MNKGFNILKQHLQSSTILETTENSLRNSFNENDVAILKKYSSFTIKHDKISILNNFNVINARYNRYNGVKLENCNSSSLQFKNFVPISNELFTFENLKKLKGVSLFYQYLNSSCWSEESHIECFELFDVLTNKEFQDLYSSYSDSASSKHTFVIILKKISNLYDENKEHYNKEHYLEIECKYGFLFVSDYLYKQDGQILWIPQYIYQKIFEKGNKIEKDEIFLSFKYNFDNLVVNQLLDDVFTKETVDKISKGL